MTAFRQCPHIDLATSLSSHALDVGFDTPSPESRAAATTPHGQARTAATQGVKAADPSVFPAPIVLPDDCLSIDPKYPAQSLRLFKRLDSRNNEEPERQTMYFAAAPGTAANAKFVKSWAQVQSADAKSAWRSAPPTMFENVFEYLQAFYHGMDVKRYDGHLRFVNVEPEPASKSKAKSHTGARTNSKSQAASHEPDQIGLEFEIEGERFVMDIRVRVSPHEDVPTYPRQLNLNDLLDAAIAMLPEDAYALLLLVDHDIYEDDDDDFACGRAYGGSRVAVVSASRYNPALDERVEGLESEHAWPASHCAKYIDEACGSREPPKKKKGVSKRTTKSQSNDPKQQVIKSTSATSPLARAVNAYRTSRSAAEAEGILTLEAQARLWLSRVCKTASHELGHCVGMDHCVYYACIMQGTASLAEDARQPPYLCPVDLAKTLEATGGGERSRYQALLELCERENWREEPMFAAYAAWLRRVLGIEDAEQSRPNEVIVID